MEQSINRAPTSGRQLVLATFQEQQQAGAAMQALRARGVPEDNISVVVRHDSTEVSPQEMAALDRRSPGKCSVLCESGAQAAVGSSSGGTRAPRLGLSTTSCPSMRSTACTLTT